MNEKNILEIVNNYKKHSKIKKFLTFVCYLIIFFAVISYLSNIFLKKNNIKIVNKLKKNENINVEKIMEKPRLTIKTDNGNLYKISAQKAYHINEDEVTMENVFATSHSGNISAGELKISERGDRLIFSKNPILIFKQ
jgi:hypothetical protein